MKKFTEEELKGIADEVYNEIKMELNESDDSLVMASAVAMLNVVNKYFMKIQEKIGD